MQASVTSPSLIVVIADDYGDDEDEGDGERDERDGDASDAGDVGGAKKDRRLANCTPLEQYLQMTSTSKGDGCGHAGHAGRHAEHAAGHAGHAEHAAGHVSHVLIAVPRLAYPLVCTLAQGGDVQGTQLAMHLGIGLLENLFAWAHMWNDRRFLFTLSEAILRKQFIVACHNDIRQCCAQFLDAVNGSRVMMGGRMLLEYRRTAAEAGATCGAVFPVDAVVRMLVFVNSYIVFVRLVPRSSESGDDEHATSTGEAVAACPFNSASHDLEFHGEHMVYNRASPLKFIPLL